MNCIKKIYYSVKFRYNPKIYADRRKKILKDEYIEIPIESILEPTLSDFGLNSFRSDIEDMYCKLKGADKIFKKGSKNLEPPWVEKVEDKFHICIYGYETFYSMRRAGFKTIIIKKLF